MALIALVQTRYTLFMRTEAKRSFTHGFLLTEAEVRRLATDIYDQLARNARHSVVSSFEVHFRNGTIAHPPNLDAVLSEGNSGPMIITRFRMSFSLDDTNPPSRYASIEFANPSRHFGKSITYTVTSDDRDWAFVVTSRIEDRLAALKRGFDPISLLFLTFVPIILAVLFLAFYLGLPIGDQEIERFYQDLQLAEIAELRDEWSSGRLTDPLDAYLRGLEILIRPKIPSELAQRHQIMRSGMILMFLVVIFGIPAIVGVEVFFPRYNFYWGAYIRKYDRRSFWGQVLYGAVVLALIVGVAGSYIANQLPQP